MQEYYSMTPLICEACDNEIQHDHEFIQYQDMNFCEFSCLTDWILDNGDIKYYYLTNREVYD